MNASTAHDPNSLFAALSRSVRSYRVVSPLMHGEMVDGASVVKEFKVGDTVELDAETAEPLLGHTVVPLG